MDEKQRLEALSDGVIAIIITIMVLNIGLPKINDIGEMEYFFGSIFIFFVSFIIVGSFWDQHRRLFKMIQNINNKLVWINLLFLFFLALIPLFTKWITEEPNATAPVVGYGTVYLFVSITYDFMLFSVVDINKHTKGNNYQRIYFVYNTIVTTIIMLLVTFLAFFRPLYSVILFIIFPLPSVMINLWLDGKRSAKE